MHFGAVGNTSAWDAESPILLLVYCSRPRDETGNWGDPPTNSALTEIDSKEAKIDTASKDKTHLLSDD